MKLLLSCVNSTHSLVGYDWDERRIFWALPTKTLRVCGACYDGNDLLVSGDNLLTRITAHNYARTEFTGRYPALAHSVHVLTEGVIGVVDTGNSQVLLVDKGGGLRGGFTPIDAWGDHPHDAIHLNDFAMTPSGVLASCFDHRPYKKVREAISWETWCTGGYGVLLNLTGTTDKGMGRVVGCGFNHPHSLHYAEPYLYLCSSATGVFHVCEINHSGVVQEKRWYPVTNDHFLRGALKVGNHWFLGGSAFRHGRLLANTIEIYHLEESSGAVVKQSIEWKAEIYDVLPWRDEVMGPIIERHFSSPAG